MLRLLGAVLVLALVVNSIRLMGKKEAAPTTPSALPNSQDYPACKIAAARNGACSGDEQTCASQDAIQRLVVIGDVHGEGTGMKELLDAANITSPSSSDTCKWIPQTNPGGTILVQVGDIVDRGAEAFEAWNCLEELQKTAEGNNKVVRLLGNHDIWWLEGKFHMINREADTKEKIVAVVNSMKRGVLDGSVVGSFVHRIGDQPLLFVHAGFRPKFVDKLQRTLPDSSAEGIAGYVNGLLTDFVQKCTDESKFFVPCEFPDEVFEAGPDRGGKGIGGPLWTDFHVIDEAATESTTVPPFIQIVGHTMAWCYDPSEPNIYPGDDVAECSLGLIRATKGLEAVCVDGGMYAGGRAFLEIGQDGVFRSYQRITGPDTPFVVKDLTAAVCQQ